MALHREAYFATAKEIQFYSPEGRRDAGFAQVKPVGSGTRQDLPSKPSTPDFGKATQVYAGSQNSASGPANATLVNTIK